MAEKATGEAIWNRETVPKVMTIVSTRLPQRDLITLLLVSPSIHRTLLSHPSLWLVLDFHEMSNAGDRLVSALSLNITDKSLHLVAGNYQELESLNITRCIKMTDSGLQRILLNCSSLQNLNLYALSTLTDEAYKMISRLPHLRFLDLCGAQNLTDDGLSCIAMCKNLVSLNLTWCVQVSDVGVIAIAQGCRSLELLSLFGILGVSDSCLEVLSSCCSNTLTTLDVNGCINIKNRSRDQLLKLFPNLICFKVHS